MKSQNKKRLLRLLSRIKHDYDSKVFYLHDVYNNQVYSRYNPCTSISRFAEMISLIRSTGFELVRELSSDERQIKLCFDDGFRGVWDNREYFLKEGVYPTVFIITSFVGRKGYLDRAEIIELDKNYGFVFQSHTANHVSITDTSISDAVLRHEMGESKMYLMDLLDKKVDSICLPRGYYSVKRLGIVREYYKNIYSSIPGSIQTKLEGGLIARNLIQDLDDDELQATIYGAQTPLSQYYRLRLRK